MESNKITEADLLEELQQLKEELDKVPSANDMNKMGRYSVAPYYRQFDSWNAALEAAGYNPNQTSKQWSRSELITELQEIAADCGRPPTTGDMTDYGNASPNTYREYFGSWSEALQAADFDPRANGVRISEEKLCTALEELSNTLDRPPESTDMNEEGAYAASTYLHRFGSWEDACNAAGIEAPTGDELSRDELISALQSLADSLNKTPQAKDMDEHGEFSAVSYWRKFGSWEEALDAAGFEGRSVEPVNKLSREELIDELKSVASEVGRVPTTTDMQQHGAYSPSTYINRFGSWDKAIQLADIEPTSDY